MPCYSGTSIGFDKIGLFDWLFYEHDVDLTPALEGLAGPYDDMDATY
ncbi:MAG: hypothetical protein GWP24_04945 [Alphaproteobacteria bacterium]|nr:hypothetical protein [Alphaproteobacteria bacterium]